MDLDMNITVLTPDKEIFKGVITSVKVPGTLGEFQVLKNHAPIVSSLQNGMVHLINSKGLHRVYNEEKGTIVEILDEGKKVSFQINGGFIEVLNNEIALLVQGVKNIG